MNQLPPPPEILDPRAIAFGPEPEDDDIEFDQNDILIERELLGKRPYQRWFGFVFAAGATCTIVHLSQYLPVIRWFLLFIFLILGIGAILDINKQNTLAGYISREYLINLAIMYGAVVIFLIVFSMFILYI